MAEQVRRAAGRGMRGPGERGWGAAAVVGGGWRGFTLGLRPRWRRAAGLAVAAAAAQREREWRRRLRLPERWAAGGGRAGGGGADRAGRGACRPGASMSQEPPAEAHAGSADGVADGPGRRWDGVGGLGGERRGGAGTTQGPGPHRPRGPAPHTQTPCKVQQPHASDQPGNPRRTWAVSQTESDTSIPCLLLGKRTVPHTQASVQMLSRRPPGPIQAWLPPDLPPGLLPPGPRCPDA